MTADRLPTVQIDGVAWTQTVVGNTVYVGGRFNNARPAGSAPGTNLTPRGNLLAYDITTGNLITSFAPTVNAQVLSVSASPDGSRIYAVGDFSIANGAARRRVAAFFPVGHPQAATDHRIQSLGTQLASAGCDRNQQRRVRRRRLLGTTERDAAEQPGGHNNSGGVLAVESERYPHSPQCAPPYGRSRRLPTTPRSSPEDSSRTSAVSRRTAWQR